MGEKISVIVPIYNVQQYLRRCIDSIINQTYENLEIILVDDGSLDNCGQICDDYAKKDTRIKVIHKKNGGLSDARNAGLEICTGDFIAFVDSDDWISYDMYEILLNSLYKYDADIAECKFYLVNNNKCIPKLNNRNVEVNIYNTIESLKSLILLDDLNTIVWNKLYKKSVLENIQFEVGRINEDDFFTYLVFSQANKIVSLYKQLYYYVQNDTSIMGQRYSLKRLDELEAKFRRLKYIKRNYKSLEKISKLDLLFSCLYSYQKLILNKNIQDLVKGRKIIKKYISESKFTYSELLTLDLKSKIYTISSSISLDLTCLVRNILKIGV